MRRQVLTMDGRKVVHREQPSRSVGTIRRTTGRFKTTTGKAVCWEGPRHYGSIEVHGSGFPIGGGPWARISISNNDETSRHDWREFQEIKNQLVGEDWEAVELYPAESRLLDPSNRFYLWCAPAGVFCFGMEEGRRVCDTHEAVMPQRGFPRCKSERS